MRAITINNLWVRFSPLVQASLSACNYESLSKSLPSPPLPHYTIPKTGRESSSRSDFVYPPSAKQLAQQTNAGTQSFGERQSITRQIKEKYKQTREQLQLKQHLVKKQHPTLTCSQSAPAEWVTSVLHKTLCEWLTVTHAQLASSTNLHHRSASCYHATNSCLNSSTNVP